MREMNMRSIDLNLLVVLDALLEERQVTGAAQRLEMSQPAVSRALQRLRELFSDPLLVRGDDGYDLSTRARHLQPLLKDMLYGVKQMVTPLSFDPARASGNLAFACLDLEATLYLSGIMETLRQQAPGMSLEIQSKPGDYFTSLARGEIHLALSGQEPDFSQDQFHRIEIDNTYSQCVMGADNPLAQGEMTLQRYLAATHGFVSISGRGPAIIDMHLKQMGYQRKVAARLASFFNVPDFCENTDLVFALPKRQVDWLCRNRRLVSRPLPKEIPQPLIHFFLYWHARYHQDPMHRWFRNLVIEQNRRSFPETVGPDLPFSEGLPQPQ
ncbi:LysR family transcriptional regulator [Marinobacterium lutimaris]|uniref:Transcriptional regulator, LysR family n=1 Tax=Marinobacterium lutimaris TaxID=568106 RepID=A0A1H5X4Y8_9GAMM|nr:LysR family transcriptional regulator [Marinobacterium lutimaris]SEG06643.1 transcriptional regulator, LysR family [Marinobacterium lutimaris]